MSQGPSINQACLGISLEYLIIIFQDGEKLGKKRTNTRVYSYGKSDEDIPCK